MRKVTNIEEQLRLDEGEKLTAYQDHLGYWTIGVGRLIDARRGGGLTKEESAYLLKNDIKKRQLLLESQLPFFKQLDVVRQGALLNMSFQLGVDGLLAFKTTLNLIKIGHYADAAKEMLNSKWAKQTPERASRLSLQIKTGVWQ